MEDVVAVELVVEGGGPHFVVTFGRLHDVVDPTALEAIVLRFRGRFGLGPATAARTCGSLREARDAPYFYESLIDFAVKVAAVAGSDRPQERWAEIAEEVRDEGRHLYYLGDPAAGTRPDDPAGD